MHIKALAVVAMLAAPFAAAAQEQAGADDIVSKIINVPAPAAHQVNGVTPAPKVVKDETVQGGKALRIAVAGKQKDAWAVSASNPIQKQVKAGDSLIVAFWAKLAKGENGAATAVLPYNAVQLAKAPYTAVFAGPATIGPEWKLHEVKGKADRDYKPGELQVTFHLATAKQTIELGPVFVLNMGQ